MHRESMHHDHYPVHTVHLSLSTHERRTVRLSLSTHERHTVHLSCSTHERAALRATFCVSIRFASSLTRPSLISCRMLRNKGSFCRNTCVCVHADRYKHEYTCTRHDGILRNSRANVLFNVCTHPCKHATRLDQFAKGSNKIWFPNAAINTIIITRVLVSLCTRLLVLLCILKGTRLFVLLHILKQKCGFCKNNELGGRKKETKRKNGKRR